MYHRLLIVAVIVFIQDLGDRGAQAQTYHWSTDYRDWDSARQWCQYHFTDMVSVQTREENDYLDQIVPGPADYWIGIRKVNGVFTWVETGENVTPEAANWATAEPSGDGPCVALFIKHPRPARTGKWNDAGCIGGRRTICYTAANTTALTTTQSTTTTQQTTTTTPAETTTTTPMTTQSRTSTQQTTTTPATTLTMTPTTTLTSTTPPITTPTTTPTITSIQITTAITTTATTITTTTTPPTTAAPSTISTPITTSTTPTTTPTSTPTTTPTTTPSTTPTTITSTTPTTTPTKTSTTTPTTTPTTNGTSRPTTTPTTTPTTNGTSRPTTTPTTNGTSPPITTSPPKTEVLTNVTGSRHVIGLRMGISSKTPLTNEDINSIVLTKLKEELVRQGIPADKVADIIMKVTKVQDKK